ncbi:MAG: hypothetical protein WC073_03185 [Sterolibacterium sp.]
MKEDAVWNQYQEFKPIQSREWRTYIDREWRAFIDPLASMADRLSGWLSNPQDEQLRHEFYKYILLNLSNGYIAWLYADTEHPDFYPFISIAHNTFVPNPDFVYCHTPLDDKGVYKISGYRGTVRTIDFQLGTGMLMARGIIDGKFCGESKANYDLDDGVHLDKDGAFEVILSPSRPEGYKGDWWQLPATVTYLMVRQISYDWLHEVDGRLAIERLDRPAIKPRPSAEKLAEQIRNVMAWTENILDVTADWSRRFTGHAEVNELKYVTPAEFALLVNQRYAWGRFELAPDEALIVEAKMPGQVRYFGFDLHDDLNFVIDWMNRQSTLNGHAAKVDKDGMLRIVISAQDPGVPNWLDNAGYEKGMICARWQKCDIYPEHTTRKVKTADVRNHLPADTPVVTFEQRDADIRNRRKGLQLRKRW